MTQPSLFDTAGSSSSGDDLIPGSRVVGLVVLTDWIDTQTQARLVHAIDEETWANALARRVQHYGWRYDYGTRSLDRGDWLGALPAWAMPLGERLATDKVFDRPADQVIVNEYQPGQGIAPHIDRDCFGSAVATLSLLDTWPMRFDRKGHDPVDLFLAPGTLMVLSSDARTRWRHSIARRKSDVLPSGIRRNRKRRISVTFRTVLL